VGLTPGNWGKIEESADASEAHHRLPYPSEQVLEQNQLVTVGTKSSAVIRIHSQERFVVTGRALRLIFKEHALRVLFVYPTAFSRKGGESTGIKATVLSGASSNHLEGKLLA
jgi:hypothetical protein